MKVKSVLSLSLVVSAALMAGCTDGQKVKIKALGGSAKITCYSAEKIIYSGKSTGKVTSSSQSDGYYFIDQKDQKLKEVSGNCVIEYEKY